MQDELIIYKANGDVLHTTPINKDCKWSYKLMEEDQITVKFSLDPDEEGGVKHFGIGCYTVYNGETWVITKTQDPTYNTGTGGYDYELTFEHDYRLWKNRIFKFTPTYGGREASWSLTAQLSVHLDVFLKNLSALGWKYNDKDYTYEIDSTVTTAAKLITYSNTSLLDALMGSGMMAETFDCECWVEYGVIHFGKCQDNTKDPVEFIVGKNVEKISRSDSDSTYATRFFIFGGEQNIPARYRKSLVFTVTNDGQDIQDTLRQLYPSYFEDGYKTYTPTEEGKAYPNATNIKDGVIKAALSKNMPAGTYDISLSKLTLTCKLKKKRSDKDTLTLTCKVSLAYGDATVPLETKTGTLPLNTSSLSLKFDNTQAVFADEVKSPSLLFELSCAWSDESTLEMSKVSVSGSATVTFVRQDDSPATTVTVMFLTGDNATGTNFDCTLNPDHASEGTHVLMLPEGLEAAAGDTYIIENILEGEVPSTYFTSDVTSQTVVNGVVQNRLMLPLNANETTEDGLVVNGSENYIDAVSGLSDKEIVEAVVVNEDIYPRFTSKDEAGDTVNGRPITAVATRKGTVENEETGEMESVTYWAIQDSALSFSKSYILDGEDLKVTFTSGLLNGMTFNVDFVKNGTSRYGKEGQWFELVRSEDYGRPLPDDILYPKIAVDDKGKYDPYNSDRFVLTGWDASYISELGLVAAAEEELKEWGLEYAADEMVDPSTYTCDMMSDDAYGENPTTGKLDDNYSYLKSIMLGDRIKLFSDAYFAKGFRVSRVIGFERNLDIPYDTPQYIIGETASYSTLTSLSEQIDELVLNGQTYAASGGGGSTLYVIKTGDSTTESDRNVYSALKTLQTFLNKTKADTMQDVLTLLRGVVIGSGGNYYITEDAKATLYKLIVSAIQSSDITTEYLTVTKKAHFFEVVIDKLRSSGGTLVLTDANCQLDLVEAYDASDNLVADDDTTTAVSYWKGYWLAKDSDGNAVTNGWAVGDLALCYTCNFAEGSQYKASNRYWWRRIEAVDDGVVTKEVNGEDVECHWMRISNKTFDEAPDTEPTSGSDEIYRRGLKSDAPEAGDSVMLMGSSDDETRQNAIVLAASKWIDNGRAAYTDGDGTAHAAITAITCPAIVQYKEVSSFSLCDARFTWFAASGNHITGNFTLSSGGDLQSYTHIAYANSSDGKTDFCYASEKAEGVDYLYMGVVSDHTSGDSHLSYTNYVWNRIKDDDTVSVVIRPTTNMGTVIKNNTGSVTLRAYVYVGGVLVENLSPSRYQWYRTSDGKTADGVTDDGWHTAHSGVGDTIEVSAKEVSGSALIECEVNYETGLDTSDDIFVDSYTGEVVVTSDVPETLTLDGDSGVITATDTAATTLAMDGTTGVVTQNT